MSGVWIALLSVSLWAAPSSKACKQMAKKICNKLGDGAFLCGVYKRIAKHRKVDHANCKAIMTDNWSSRLASLKRQEATLSKMDSLALRSGGTGLQQVTVYKHLWSSCRMARMLKGASENPEDCRKLARLLGQTRNSAQIHPQACQHLTRLVCKTLGNGAFYCNLFAQVTKSPSVRPEKCQVIISVWASSQREHYQKREASLQWMAKTAQQNRTLLSKLNRIKQREMVRLYAFLHKP